MTEVDTARRVVIMRNARVPYDYLILATGARHSYFGHDDWALFAPGLKQVEDATSIRSRLLFAFEEAENAQSPEVQREMLTFLIVGGGPTGVELRRSRRSPHRQARYSAAGHASARYRAAQWPAS